MTPSTLWVVMRTPLLGIPYLTGRLRRFDSCCESVALGVLGVYEVEDQRLNLPRATSP